MSTRGYTPAILADVGLFPVNVALAAACFYLLADAKAAQLPPRTKVMLSLFTVLLGGLALAAILVDSVYFVNYVHLVSSNCGWASSHLRGLFRAQMLPETLPIVLWCVEGFMLWRACVHLQHVNQFLLGLFSASLVAISIWSSSIVLIHRFGWTRSSFEETYHIITISTAIINLIITGIIASRLRYLDWPISKIFLESGALLTLNAVLAALFFPIRGWMSFAVIIMPQIAILSALLVVFQIARKDEGLIRLDEHSSAPSEVGPEVAPVAAASTSTPV